jgi:predicted phage-related endonuclease
MQTHDVIQGSPEWLAQRLNTYNASDAPAMLGCSPYETRSQLIARLATGIVPEVDAATQRRFDDGHRFEALARPLAVEIIGEDLYPVSGSEDFGLDKPLAASLDGSTITDEIVWEHKSLNDELRAVLPEQIVGEVFVGSVGLGAKLPKLYRVQMEQQLMVSGAGKVLFTASKWNADDTLVEARHCWYQSDLALRAEILGGWKQLAEDVKAYVPPAASALEKIVAEPVEALPAPVVRVAGQITLEDNFKAFEERLREFLATKLIREPKTDEDFVNLDSQIKAMKSAREALKAAESQMLAQVQPVDQAKKTKDMLDTLLQQNVSMAEKIMTAEKERRKGEIVAVGVKGLADHIAALNERLGKPYMPAIPADFGGAVKGLKSMSSMEDKVTTELARAKIAASEIADKIELNLKWLRENATEYVHLFADTAQLVLKAPDDFKAAAQLRITTEKQRVQAEHDRIREEAAAAARKKLEDDAAARKALEAVSATPASAPAAPAPAPFTPVAAAPVKVNPVPPAANDDAVINVGEINERIKPLQISAAGLQELGFQPVPRKGAGVFFRESDYPRMCEALIQHLTQVADLQAA